MPTSNPPTETLTQKLASSDDALRQVQVARPDLGAEARELGEAARSRYLRKRVLGAGGMGQVTLAVDRPSDATSRSRR